MCRDTGAEPYGQMGVMNGVYEIDGKSHLDFTYLLSNLQSQPSDLPPSSQTLPHVYPSAKIRGLSEAQSSSTPTALTPRSSNSTAAHGIVPFVRWRLYLLSVTLSNG
jgi:hypothetical protein